MLCLSTLMLAADAVAEHALIPRAPLEEANSTGTGRQELSLTAISLESGTASLVQSAEEDVPLVRHLYTADPAAHVFDGQLWLYTSHDQSAPSNLTGADRFNMRDYHVFSFHSANDAGRDEGVALSLENVPWASKQMWAPDVAQDDDGFHLFFPAKDAAGIFRIGHAQAADPYGPFVADEEPLDGSLSIDPAVFVDGDVTFPRGSVWARNPLPRIWDSKAGLHDAEACPGPTTREQGSPAGCLSFPAPCPWDTYTTKGLLPCSLDDKGLPDKCDGDGMSQCSSDWVVGVVSDRVLVPHDLPAGEYVLSWRWDAEETAQIWANCADVSISAAASATVVEAA